MQKCCNFKKYIVDVNQASKDWVKHAEQLIGTPYKWGGRDTIGIDCSALLQLSLFLGGIKAPRNTNEQIKMKFKTINKLNEIKRGAVIFWKGHVGILSKEKTLIHANAFSMKVTKEPLSKAIDRMSSSYGNIKRILSIN